MPKREIESSNSNKYFVRQETAPIQINFPSQMIVTGKTIYWKATNSNYSNVSKLKIFSVTEPVNFKQGNAPLYEYENVMIPAFTRTL